MQKVKKAQDNQQDSLQYGMAMHAVIPIRREPREQSEMVSQLLFGEIYRVEDFSLKWLRIITSFDHYPGWIDRKLFREISRDFYAHLGSTRSAVLAAKTAELKLQDSSALFIPAGSNLPGYDPFRNIISIAGVEFEIRPVSGYLVLNATQQIIQTAIGFLNSPYLWGGRSWFGFDCSGFVQVVYKIHGFSLPRDTAQQAETGIEVRHFRETRPGDLAFFADEKDNINHVGIIISPVEIIHCSGWVRIDRLEPTGIINRESGTLTHRLQSLRRIS